jgi:hypothetical protein
MSKKDLLKEELNRIQRMMGINEALLMEQPIPMPKSLIKNILKSSDDVAEPLLRIFNLTDNQIDDVIRQIDRVGVDNLSDDVLEALARNSIDNVDELARLLKVGKYLGSNFDEIAIKIFDRVDSMDQISPEVRKKVVDIYKKKLDEIPFLENSDEIKQKLVRDFQTEFDTKFSDKLVRGIASSLDNQIDDFFNLVDEYGQKVSDNIANNTPGLPPDLKKEAKRYWDTFWTKKETYAEMLKRRAPYAKSVRLGKGETEKILPGGADIGGKSLDDIQRIIDRPTEQQRIIIDNIIRSNWWTALPTLIKGSIMVVILTGGGAVTTGQLTLDIINGLLALGNEGINKLILSKVEQKLKEKEGIITTLTPKNVENWFSEAYPASYLDSDNFKNNFTVSINNTKTKAVIQTNDESQEWEVSISGDNKIQEIK